MSGAVPVTSSHSVLSSCILLVPIGWIVARLACVETHSMRPAISRWRVDCTSSTLSSSTSTATTASASSSHPSWLSLVLNLCLSLEVGWWLNLLLIFLKVGLSWRRLEMRGRLLESWWEKETGWWVCKLGLHLLHHGLHLLHLIHEVGNHSLILRDLACNVGYFSGNWM